MLHFDLKAHFPHPPGFPGLLVLGQLPLPLAGTPFRALQWLSAISSVLILWPLAALGRRVAPAAVATAAALLVLFLPGPWLFSVRGFSTWTATTLAIAATALWSDGLHGRRITWFTLLVAASFLVRPILLPTLALLWFAGICTVKPHRRVLPGALAGAALVGLSVLVMARIEGGWPAFVEPFVVHTQYHAGRLHLNEPGLKTLGLVKGAGGPAWAAVLLLASLVGFGAWWRRAGARTAAAWLAIIGVTVAQFILLQNRSHARYATAVHVASAPLLAGAAAIAPAPVAAVGLLGLAGFAAWTSLPLLVEQHREPFGAWEATVESARLAGERGWAAVVEPNTLVHVFSSYWWHLLEWKGEPTPPLVFSSRSAAPRRGLHRPWVVATARPYLFWPSLTGNSTAYGEVSDRLEPLTQSRFLSAELIENPPLPIGQWWTRQELPDGTTFMWAGPNAELWLPPVPPNTLLGIGLRPAAGEAPLVVILGHGTEPRIVDGHAPLTWLWTRTTADSPSGPVIVQLKRARGYPPDGADNRPLGAQLRGVVVRPPGAAYMASVATASERAALRLEIAGGYSAETFGWMGRGVWLAPKAVLQMRLDEPGRLVLKIAAPRPTPANPRIAVEGEPPSLPLALAPGVNRIDVEASADALSDGVIELAVLSEPFIPAETGTGTDTRHLGVVLLGLEFEPAAPSTGWWRESPCSCQ
jgi:hypothetical protein